MERNIDRRAALALAGSGLAAVFGARALPERITAAVYRQQPYAARGRYDTAHAPDRIYREAGGSTAELKLTRRPSGQRGYVGTIALGVLV